MRASQELHDQLRAALPAGASCVDDCPFCTDPEVASQREEKVSDKVYDQATLDALLADARSKASEEAKSEASEEIADLKAKLQEAESERDKAKAEVEDLQKKVTELETEKLGDERAKLIKDATDLSDEKIAERKSAWAKMDEDAFYSMLEDMKATREAASSGKPKPKEEQKPPSSEDLDGTRETAGEEGTDLEKLRKSMSTLLGVGG